MTKRLLFSLTKKDFEVETMRGSGPGGQHRNKTDSAVRIRHIASGATGESSSDRSQYTNKRLAFEHLVQSKKFQAWHKTECARRLATVSVEDVVDTMMNLDNIKIEVKDSNGKWSEITDELDKLEAGQVRIGNMQEGGDA